MFKKKRGKMKQYFNVFLEFNHDKFYNTVGKIISEREKGYVCVVDANVLTMAQGDLGYREVLNLSSVNTCDGSSIAMMAGWAHHQKVRALNGPEIFENYIEKDYSQLLLGSTPETYVKIKEVLQKKNKDTSHLRSLPLPFVAVEDFDYKSIAGEINRVSPDIIWVSLGAPKQEIFMNKILPFLDRGVLLGIGAAFNFYIGDLNVPRFTIGSLRFIWLNRLINEPKKLIRRILPYIALMPKLYFQEKRKNKIAAQNSSSSK
jgi:N-acetylglucosaminyldiphosphoundecaprenol N-acetyl-beta-D-mannosaminyltransferase